MQKPHHQRSHNQQSRKNRSPNEPFMVLRSIDLLPHDQRQPSLDDISHLVHRSRHQSSFFIIVRANLVRPSEAKPGQAHAKRSENVASPLPGEGNVPDSERSAGDDIRDAAENHRGPPRAFEERIGTPGVRQGRDDDDGLRDRRVDVDLRDAVGRVFAVFEELREHGRRRAAAVVEDDVQHRQGVDVPGREDLPELGAGVGFAASAPFDLHAL